MNLSSFTPYFPLIVVLIGWYVVNRQNNSRETRKETRSLIDGAKKIADDIVTKSIAYYCDGKAELSHELKADFERLEIELERFSDSPEKLKPLFEALVDFTDAVTGGAFESSQKSSLGKDDPVILRIRRARNDFVSHLERKFKLAYH